MRLVFLSLAATPGPYVSRGAKESVRTTHLTSSRRDHIRLISPASVCVLRGGKILDSCRRRNDTGLLSV